MTTLKATPVLSALPSLGRGVLLRCTNRNTREFTHGDPYRIECMAGHCGGEQARPMVRNNDGELRVVTALAWALCHWDVVGE